VLVSIVGEVAWPVDLHAPELAGLADAVLVADFHCREGWSRAGVRWRGVRLSSLLALVGPTEHARFVTVAAGDYAAVLTREEAEDGRVLLALERDGVPLDTPAGLPRLVGPSEWDCFQSVKAVDRIELTREPAGATAAAIALARIYPRSEALVRATRDLGRGRTGEATVARRRQEGRERLLAVQRDHVLAPLTVGMLDWPRRG
jgi:DMSO/TMAO reductase YedYZ molybdopterin-dependent catalytic subunit